MAEWLRGLGDVHWPQIWVLPKIPPRGRHGNKSRMQRNIHRLPHAKSTSRLYFLKTAMGPLAEEFRQCTLASNLGPWEKCLLLNNHTSLGRLGSVALAGSQSRRRASPIQNPRVPGVLDRLDERRPWVHGHVCASRNRAPAIGQLPPCLRGRFFSPRLGKGLRQKTYSFVVATTVLACSATVEREP